MLLVKYPGLKAEACEGVSLYPACLTRPRALWRTVVSKTEDSPTDASLVCSSESCRSRQALGMHETDGNRGASLTWLTTWSKGAIPQGIRHKARKGNSL